MRLSIKAASIPAIGRPATRERARAASTPLGATKAFAFLAIALGLVALLPVIQSSNATTTGYRVRQLEQTNARWQARLASLEAEVAGLGSLQRVEQRARELGMQPVQDPVYVEVDEPGPVAPHVPRRYVPSPSTVQPADQNWWDFLPDLLPFWHISPSP